MIPKEVKQSPIFGEFSPDEAYRYFDYSRDRSVAHVDTFYYTVTIYGDDSQEPSENLSKMISTLLHFKSEKATNYSATVDFFGLNVELTRFVHYDICLRMNECFDIFISSKFVNADTPRIVVQLRTRMLLLDGVCQAICKSFKYVERILHAFGLDVQCVMENRIDYTCFEDPSIDTYYSYATFTDPDGVKRTVVADFEEDDEDFEGAAVDFYSTFTLEETTTVDFYILVKADQSSLNVNAMPVLVEGDKPGDFYE